MKRFFSLIALMAFSSLLTFAQDIVSSKSMSVSFYSEAPLEDIEATSQNGVVLLNTAKNDISFNIQIKSFVFDKSLMQEHFNENYMESDKFPVATFRGIIKGPVDYKKDGEYKVTATGKLTIHGEAKDRTIDGIITVKDGIINLNSEFMVACKDHHIEIPSLMSEKIGEIVKVTVSGSFDPPVKK